MEIIIGWGRESIRNAKVCPVSEEALQTIDCGAWRNLFDTKADLGEHSGSIGCEGWRKSIRNTKADLAGRSRSIGWGGGIYLKHGARSGRALCINRVGRNLIETRG